MAHWAWQFLDPSGRPDTMKLLRAMTHGISERVRLHAAAVEKGVQSPEETLQSRRGSCRDFAVLMMEGDALAGYRGAVCQRLYFRAEHDTGGTGAAAPRTHGCRPTCPAPAGSTSIPPTASSAIAISFASPLRGLREQVLPLWGTFVGSAASFLGMDVTVTVTEDG